jgi:hypothetical protein
MRPAKKLLLSYSFFPTEVRACAELIFLEAPFAMDTFLDLIRHVLEES